MTAKLKECVDIHLENCPKCKKKVEELLEIYEKYQQKTVNTSNKQQSLSNNFVNNLSAYVDNELNIHENVKIKKLAISNPLARQELESMYKFKKMLQMSFEKTKNETKYDCAKNIIAKIQEAPDYSTSYFYKLAIIFVALIASIVGCFLYLYL